ncbi:MAG TPA: response regulator transcription factor [Candidatus Limnocylindrales bacterium]
MVTTELEGYPDGELRVLIVDDDRRVRQSLAGLIALRDHLAVVGTAGTPERALELAASERPDAILLDLRLPEAEDGIRLLADLLLRRPGVRIVAMSVAPELRDLALRAGADAFVTKSSQSEAIGDALAGLLDH